MALCNTAAFSSKSVVQPEFYHQRSPSFSCNPTNRCVLIAAVLAADPARTPFITNNKPTVFSSPSESVWAPETWKTKKALHLPDYPDEAELEAVLRIMEAYPPLVFVGEVRSLKDRLGQAALGKAFLLQGGDCAESFKEFNANNIRDTFRILLQMGVVLSFGGQLPVFKVGRMAGQFAKPRSDPFEEQDGVKLPSYKGDNINGDAFDKKSRIPDPNRMIRAYCQAASTLNLLRAFTTGGYAAMQRVTQWNLDFVEHSEQGDILFQIQSCDTSTGDLVHNRSDKI